MDHHRSLPNIPDHHSSSRNIHHCHDHHGDVRTAIPRHIMVGVGVKSNPGGPGEHPNTWSMNVQWMFIPRMFEIPGQMIPTSRPFPLWDFLPFLSCFGKRTEKGWKRLVSRHQHWLSIFVLTADRSCREYPQAHSNTRYQKKDLLCVFFLGPCM